MLVLVYDKIEDIKKFDKMRKMAEVVVKKEDGCLKIEKNRFMIDEKEILDMLKEENAEIITGTIGDLKTIDKNIQTTKRDKIEILNEYELIYELPIPRTIKEIIYKINEIVKYINKEDK